MKRLKTWFQEKIADTYRTVARQHDLVLHRRDLQSGRLVMGKHTYGVPEIHHYQGSEGRVFIGNYCSISPGVVFITGGIHPLNWVSTFPFRVMWNLPGQLEDGTPATWGDIHVGSDVWIGTDAMIMSGVTIGHGALIAARSVVTHDIPPYALAGGIPPRPIRTRFPQDVIDRLLEIKWWDWSEEEISKAIPYLSSNRIDEFLTLFGKR